MRTDSYWAEREDATEEGSSQAPAEVRLKKHVRRAPSDHYPVFARLSYDKDVECGTAHISRKRTAPQKQ